MAENCGVTYKQFRKRDVLARGVMEKRGWRLKLYSVTCEHAHPGLARFEPGIDLILEQLPVPDPQAGRPGVGFLILHAGEGADYAVLCWWDRENELPIRVAVREQRDSLPWRAAGRSESVCVWDLEIIAAERDLYVATMLDGKDVENGVREYLKSLPAGGRAERATNPY